MSKAKEILGLLTEEPRISKLKKDLLRKFPGVKVEPGERVWGGGDDSDAVPSTVVSGGDFQKVTKWLSSSNVQKKYGLNRGMNVEQIGGVVYIY